MTNFADTTAAADFIATAASRETSEEIMEAIAFCARDEAEAVKIWEDCPGREFLTAIVEIVTNNGMLETTDFEWGAMGSDWENQLDEALS